MSLYRHNISRVRAAWIKKNTRNWSINYYLQFCRKDDIYNISDTHISLCNSVVVTICALYMGLVWETIPSVLVIQRQR